MRNLDIKKLIFLFPEERLSSYQQCLHLYYFACRQNGMYSASATIVSTKIWDIEAYFFHTVFKRFPLILPAFFLCLPRLCVSSLCHFAVVEMEFQKQQTNAFWLSVTIIWWACLTSGLSLSNFLQNINNCTKVFMTWQSIVLRKIFIFGLCSFDVFKLNKLHLCFYKQYFKSTHCKLNRYLKSST